MFFKGLIHYLVPIFSSNVQLIHEFEFNVQFNT